MILQRTDSQSFGQSQFIIQSYQLSPEILWISNEIQHAALRFDTVLNKDPGNAKKKS